VFKRGEAPSLSQWGVLEGCQPLFLILLPLSFEGEGVGGEVNKSLQVIVLIKLAFCYTISLVPWLSLGAKALKIF
jgi:hypothetical protein